MSAEELKDILSALAYEMHTEGRVFAQTYPNDEFTKERFQAQIARIDRAVENALPTQPEERALQALYDEEAHFGIDVFWDDGFDWRYGNIGISEVRGNVRTFPEVVAALWAAHEKEKEKRDDN